MGVTTKAITFVGKEFRNEAEGIVYFKSKVKMTACDLDEMGPHLHYWLDKRQKEGFPQCGLFSIWSGDENCGYYIGYNVYDANPEKMQKNIADASTLWENMFREKAQICQIVLYS